MQDPELFWMMLNLQTCGIFILSILIKKILIAAVNSKNIFLETGTEKFNKRVSLINVKNLIINKQVLIKKINPAMKIFKKNKYSNLIMYFVIMIPLSSYANSGAIKYSSAGTIPIQVNADPIVDTYPAPEGTEKAPDFTVSVNGKDAFVYDILPSVVENTAVIPDMPFSYFGFSGSVKITITKKNGFSNAVIRPLNDAIKYTESGNSLIFTLSSPQNLVVEFDGNLKRPLMIFANPREVNIPDKKDQSVVYWDKGVTDVGNEFVFRSNTTYYVAGGAVVKGSFITLPNSRNVKITGPGILFNNDTKPHHSLNANKTSSLSIINTIFVNPTHTWTVDIYNGCVDVNLTNVKILASYKDGLDIGGVGNGIFDRCFIMSCDDAIALKATNNTTYGNNNITVQNCTINQLGGGNSLEIGFEANTGVMNNITFKNIDILHSLLGKTQPPPKYENDWATDGVITIHLNNGVHIKNVLYDNIRVEDSNEDFLIALRIWKGPYFNTQNYGAILGDIDGLTFRHIYFSNSRPLFAPSRGVYSLIKGFDKNHMIKNISFTDLVIDGKPVMDIAGGKFDVNEFVGDIKFNK